MHCKFKYCNDVTGKKLVPFYVHIYQNIFFYSIFGKLNKNYIVRYVM